MTVTEMWALIGSGACLLIILFSLIKIKPLEINIWSWILRKIGKAFQGEMIDVIHQVNNKVDNLEIKIDTLDIKMTKHEAKDAEDKILNKRKDILEFADEIYDEKYHSKEHFEEMLELIDDYENYCGSHPNFENNKALIAIQRIKDVYQDCLENHKFK